MWSTIYILQAVTTYQTQRASYQLTYFSQSQGMWFAFSADSDKVSHSFDQLRQFKGVWSRFPITQPSLLKLKLSFFRGHRRIGPSGRMTVPKRMFFNNCIEQNQNKTHFEERTSVPKRMNFLIPVPYPHYIFGLYIWMEAL